MQMVQLLLESFAVDGLGVGVLEESDFLMATAFLSGKTCTAEEAAENQNAQLVKSE